MMSNIESTSRKDGNYVVPFRAAETEHQGVKGLKPNSSLREFSNCQNSPYLSVKPIDLDLIFPYFSNKFVSRLKMLNIGLRNAR